MEGRKLQERILKIKGKKQKDKTKGRSTKTCSIN